VTFSFSAWYNIIQPRHVASFPDGELVIFLLFPESSTLLAGTISSVDSSLGVLARPGLDPFAVCQSFAFWIRFAHINNKLPNIDRLLLNL
jgi:hypothetical protein